ncbi:MAG: hypothetical protein Q7K34_03240 [archaeon]|nr:hypothetical protein [archaeon]
MLLANSPATKFSEGLNGRGTGSFFTKVFQLRVFTTGLGRLKPKSISRLPMPLKPGLIEYKGPDHPRFRFKPSFASMLFIFGLAVGFGLPGRAIERIKVFTGLKGFLGQKFFSMKKELIVIVAAGILIFAGIFFLAQKPVEHEGEFHEHADFKVILDGKEIDFALPKYMTTEEQILSSFVHLHDGDGKVLHTHAKGVTLGVFFESLGMKFSKECFVLDRGEQFCNGNGKTLKLFVNGKLNQEFENYEPQDLDRILVTFGDETEDEIEQQINSVSDNACIQSLKCPERGTPANESSCTKAGCTI